MPATLTITVARTGGFAGLKREWSVSSALDDEDELMRLVEACPWHEPPRPDPEARDRFVYLITVRAPRSRRSATVPESSMTGPWKTLVLRVTDPPKPPEKTTITPPDC